MCHLVIVLLAVVAGYAGAATIERCCSQKMVGGVNYTLVEAMDTSSYGCDWDCIYEKDDGKRTCFKVGGKAVVCDEEAQNVPCNICLFGYCHNCLYPCNEYGGNATECYECIIDDCPYCLPQCGFTPIADEGTETVNVPEYTQCDKCLIEDNCTNCSEPCSYYGNATECYECINADCPDCLYPCGFTPITDGTETETETETETGSVVDSTCNNCVNGSCPHCLEPCSSKGNQTECYECTKADCPKCEGQCGSVNCVMNNTRAFGAHNLPSWDSYKVPKWEWCQQSCRNNFPKNCMAWSWGPWNNGQCFLFSKFNHTRFLLKWVSGHRC